MHATIIENIVMYTIKMSPSDPHIQFSMICLYFIW